MDYSGEENLEVMTFAKNYNTWLVKEILSALKTSDEEIVDFGAGMGTFARMVGHQGGKKVMCIEPAENMQPYLKDLRHCKSIEELPDDSQDFIYSLNVLEHIENDVEILRQMKRKLRVGGRAFIYVPAFPCLYAAMDKKVGHVRRYRRKELIEKITAAGFKIRECRYADFGGFFASLLFKFLPAQNGDINPRTLVIYDKYFFPISCFFDKVTGGKILGKNLLLCAEKEEN